MVHFYKKVLLRGQGGKILSLLFLSFLPRGVYSGWGIVVSLLVRTSVRPYVRPSQKFLISNDIFGFLGPSHQQFLKIFKIFEKSDFLGRPRPFFDHFFQYIRGYSGRAASQEIYAGMVLFADFESIQLFARTFFSFFQKKFSLALQIKLKIGD